MKRIAALLAAGAVMLTGLSGCGEDEKKTEVPEAVGTQPEREPNPLVDVETTDWWGEKSIAVLGDSVSFGAGCSGSITDNSYVGILRKAINEATGSTNYGFVSSYPTNWGNPRSDEIHTWPTMTGGPGVVGNPDGWEELDDGRFLTKIGMTAYDRGATITYTLSEGYDYDYFCVYYHTGPDRGAFSVGATVDGTYIAKAEVSGDVTTYDCDNTVEETKRTGFFAMSEFPEGLTITVESEDSSPVSITGIAYYNDISGEAVTFHNYSRGGLMFCEVSDTVLDQVASSGTLILGVGYNDVHWGAANLYFEADFTDRVDYLIEAVNRNGTKLIVNDYIWDNPETVTNAFKDDMKTHCRAELQRLAEETGGIYINQSEIHGDAIMTELNKGDGVHPNDAGHRMMADAILEAMGLGEGETA